MSSCLSLPSRARPRFWRFAESRGVTEYVLEKVELAATFSLEGWERRGQSQRQPGGAQHHCRHLCRASPALPMQLLDHFLLSFPPLFPLYNHFFFLPPNFTLSLFLLSGAEAVSGLKNAKRGDEEAGEQLCTFPRDRPSHHWLVLLGSCSQLLCPLLPLHLLF